MSIIYKDLSQVRIELVKMNQRKMKAGELFILARVISNRIPLPTSTQTLTSEVLANGEFYNQVRYLLNEYTYISDEEMVELRDNIKRFQAWKYSIVNGDDIMLFSGDPETVIDEFSGLTRFFDMGTLCKLDEIAEDATYYYNLYNTMTSLLWVNYQDRRGS